MEYKLFNRLMDLAEGKQAIICTLELSNDFSIDEMKLRSMMKNTPFHIDLEYQSGDCHIYLWQGNCENFEDLGYILL